jgi:hypothetical protein
MYSVKMEAIITRDPYRIVIFRNASSSFQRKNPKEWKIHYSFYEFWAENTYQATRTGHTPWAVIEPRTRE